MAKLIPLTSPAAPPSVKVCERRLKHATNQKIGSMPGEALRGLANDPRWRPLLYMVEVVALNRDVIYGIVEMHCGVSSLQHIGGMGLIG